MVYWWKVRQPRATDFDGQPPEGFTFAAQGSIIVRPTQENCSCEPLSREILQEAVDHIRAQHDHDKIAE